MKSPEKVLKSDLPGRTYAFDGLTVDVSRRVVQRGDAIIHLYPRAFDALVLLIEQRSAVVSKDALMARLWPDVIVEENSLARLVSDLRKALGEAGG